VYTMLQDALSIGDLHKIDPQHLPSSEQVKRMSELIREHPDMLAVTIVSLQQSVSQLRETTEELHGFLHSVKTVHNKMQMWIPLLAVAAVEFVRKAISYDS